MVVFIVQSDKGFKLVVLVWRVVSASVAKKVLRQLSISGGPVIPSPCICS